MLQLDGYESYLNALEAVDTQGHIREAVSPGDCTDLCSTIDQELGCFIKDEFNKSFRRDFNARPDRWQKGKVSCRERRTLFGKWCGDAVDELMKRRDIIRRAFRGTAVGIDVNGIQKKHIRFPGFATYVPPEKDEVHNDDPLTDAEIKDLAKREEKFQKERKKRKQREKDAAIRSRAKKRAKDLKSKKPTM